MITVPCAALKQGRSPYTVICFLSFIALHSDPLDVKCSLSFSICCFNLLVTLVSGLDNVVWFCESVPAAAGRDRLGT